MHHRSRSPSDDGSICIWHLRWSLHLVWPERALVRYWYMSHLWALSGLGRFLLKSLLGGYRSSPLWFLFQNAHWSGRLWSVCDFVEKLVILEIMGRLSSFFLTVYTASFSVSVRGPCVVKSRTSYTIGPPERILVPRGKQMHLPVHVCKPLTQSARQRGPWFFAGKRVYAT